MRFSAWVSQRDFAVLPVIAISHPVPGLWMVRVGWFCFFSLLEFDDRKTPH